MQGKAFMIHHYYKSDGRNSLASKEWVPSNVHQMKPPCFRRPENFKPGK